MIWRILISEGEISQVIFIISHKYVFHCIVAISSDSLPCDFDESDAAPELSIVIGVGGECSRTHDISPADIWKR